MSVTSGLRNSPARMFGLGIRVLNKLAGGRVARTAAKAILHGLYGLFGDTLVLAWEVRIPHGICEGVRVEAVRHGVRRTLDLEDNTQRVMYFTGWYERDFSRWLFAELRQGDVYLDIGAHIGMHAVAAARRLAELGGGTVFAIEATADSAEKIRATAQANGIGNIRVVQVALGAEPGTLRLYTDDRYPANDAAVRSQFNNGRLVAEVPMARLDDIAGSIGLTRADIVKIDIEGGEAAALQGMAGTLRRLAPRFVTVEVEETRLAQAGTTAATIDGLLSECGYRPSGEIFLTNVLYERLAA